MKLRITQYAVAVGMLGLLGMIAVSLGERSSQGRRAGVVGSGPSESRRRPDLEPVDVESSRFVVTQPNESVPAEGDGEAAELSPDSREVADLINVSDLRAAFENTLYGQIDPNDFLRVGLALDQYDVGDEPLESSTEKKTRYPILGLPEGLRGQLVVCKSPNYGSVRMYAIDCDLPEGYFLEGAFRLGMHATIGIFTDHEGEFDSFALHTQVGLSGENMRVGNTPHNKVPEGMHYAVTMATLLTPTVYQLGRDNNVYSRWDTVPTVKGPPLEPEDLELLKTNLLSSHFTSQK